MRSVYEHKSYGYLFFKRFFDIIFSVNALAVLAPVLLITAVAIRCEDGGRAIFTQTRAGRDMKPFKMYKFRSMYVNADAQLPGLLARNEQDGHAFKIKDDPRITKVGRFIRRYCIDEIPQFINVIRGDMSLVGPRPILDWQMEACSDYEKQRVIVRPGLTCYWQVGGRSDIKWNRWVEMDLDYIRDMSVLTDLVLILRTIPAVFSKRGGY